jgi:hypothetical protein
LALLIDLFVMVGLLVILYNFSVSNIIPSWAVFVGTILFCFALISRLSVRFFRGLFGGRLVRLVFTIGMPILATLALIANLSSDYPSDNVTQI